MITLSSKLSPQLLTDDERLLRRLTEVWGFFWIGVLPYLEGIFLPLRWDREWLNVEAKGKTKATALATTAGSVYNGLASAGAAANGGSFTGSSPNLSNSVPPLSSSSPAFDPEEPSIDVRRLALMAFRDHLILPIYPRLARLFNDIYDAAGSRGSSRRPSREDTVRSKSRSRSRSRSPGDEATASPHTTRPSSPTKSHDAQPGQRSRTRSFLTPHPNVDSTPRPSISTAAVAPMEDSYSMHMHAKRLQMVSLLCSVLTDDDRQTAMEELGRTMRKAYEKRRGSAASGVTMTPGRSGTASARENMNERRRGWIKARTIRRRGGRGARGGVGASGEEGRDEEEEWIQSLRSPDHAASGHAHSPGEDWGRVEHGDEGDEGSEGEGEESGLDVTGFSGFSRDSV